MSLRSAGQLREIEFQNDRRPQYPWLDVARRWSLHEESWEGHQDGTPRHFNGSRPATIKYAYARSIGDGRLLTLITADPIVLLGAGLPDAKPAAGYDLGLVLLEVAASGPGKGELVPAAKVKIDAQGAVVTEDYSGETVQLTQILRK